MKKARFEEIGWDFFIAHPNSTDAKASELYSLLARRRFKVFADHINIEPGKIWPSDVDEALKKTSVILVLIPSSNIDSSFFTQTEVISALHLAKSFPDRHKVIPIYLDGLPNDFMEIHYSLRLIQGIDVTQVGGLENAANKLTSLFDLEHFNPDPAEKNLATNKQIHALHIFPTGPLVEPFFIRRSIIESFAKMIRASESKLVLSEANAFRMEADPESNPDGITVNPIYLPDPLLNVFGFWQSVFAEACLHGPRMLAALILTIPDDRFSSQARLDRNILLEKLKKHS